MFHITIVDDQHPEQVFEKQVDAYVLNAVDTNSSDVIQRFCIPPREELVKAIKDFEKDPSLFPQLAKLLNCANSLLYGSIGFAINCAQKHELIHNLINGIDFVNDVLIEDKSIHVSITKNEPTNNDVN